VDGLDKYSGRFSSVEKIETVTTLQSLGQLHRKRTRALLFTAAILTAALAVSAVLFAGHFASPSTVSPGNLPSWNPDVSCRATLATLHQVIGNHFNSSTQGALMSGGPFGALTETDQSSLHPPCTAPNVNGTVAPTFVEIHGVLLTARSIVEDGAVGGKCGTKYTSTNGGGPYPGDQTFCDAYGVFQDSSEYTGNCETFDNPNPKICIRLEIDRDWMAAGYCGAGTVCNNSTFDAVNPTQKIDVQGFVAWHPPSSSGHGYSAWELHPLTAWRVSNGTLAAFSMSASPTTMTVPVGSTGTKTMTLNSLYNFAGTVNLSGTIVPSHTTASLSIVDPTVSFGPASVVLTTNRTGSLTMSMSASFSQHLEPTR
jgi:hypothetical protein